MPAYRIHRLIGMGGDQFVAALLGDDVEREHGDALRAAWQAEYEPLRAEVRPLPGASALIERARGAGWRVVFASDLCERLGELERLASGAAASR